MEDVLNGSVDGDQVLLQRIHLCRAAVLHPETKIEVLYS